MNKQARIVIALVVLGCIIVIPSFVVYKLFFATDNSGPVKLTDAGTTASTAVPNAPTPNNAGPTPAAPAPTTPLAVVTPAKPNRPPAKPRPGAAAPKGKRPPVLGGIPAVTGTVPADIAPGPIADANGGPITDEIRRAYLEKLWAGGAGTGNTNQLRYADLVYSAQVGTVLPTTQPVDSPVGPTLVTLHVSGSLMSVLEALASQTQIHFASIYGGLFHSTAATIKIDADQQPLMEVLAEICSQAALQPMSQIELQQRGGNVAVSTDSSPRIVFDSLQPRTTLGPWVVSGAFAYMADRIEHNAAVGLSPGQYGGGEADLFIVSRAEPRLHMLVGPGNLTVTEAVDELGNSLLAGNRPVSVMSRWGGPPPWGMTNYRVELPIGLTCPPNFGRTLARVKAVDHCVVEVKGEPVKLAVPTPGTPVKKSVGGMDITASMRPEDAGMGPGNMRVTMTYHRTTMAAGDWSRMKDGLPGAGPQAVDADGNVMQLQNIEQPNSRQEFVPGPVSMWDRLVGGVTGRQMQQGGTWRTVSAGEDADTLVRTYQYWTYGNQGPRTVDHLEMLVPTEVAAIDVPVEFDNLPLP